MHRVGIRMKEPRMPGLLDRIPSTGIECTPTLQQSYAPTYFASSMSVVPVASGLTPSSSIGAPARLTQKVLRPNDLAPAASHPPKAAKTMLFRGNLNASSAIL